MKYSLDSLRTIATSQLLDLWDLTTENNDPNIFTVRGWLMDEIQHRFPSAFDAWLDLDAPEDSQLRLFVLANTMCYTCKKFPSTCASSKNHVYTGCIFKEV